MTNKKFYLEILILSLLIIFNIIIDVQSPEKIKTITREDGIVEMGTAVFYFFAAIILFVVFYKSRSDKNRYFLNTRRNYFFLLLGLLLFFFGGEEISWGQRLFNYHVPAIESINKQHEINLHNLQFLHGSVNSVKKTGLARLFLSGSGVFALFCFFYCIFLPLIIKYYDQARNLNEKFKIPLMPIWIGLLFLFNHIICESIESLKLVASIPIVEIKEANYSVLFFIASISIYSIYVSGFKYNTYK